MLFIYMCINPWGGELHGGDCSSCSSSSSSTVRDMTHITYILLIIYVRTYYVSLFHRGHWAAASVHSAISIVFGGNGICALVLRRLTWVRLPSSVAVRPPWSPLYNSTGDADPETWNIGAVVQCGPLAGAGASSLATQESSSVLLPFPHT